MARCVNCPYPTHEQYKGHAGRWLCFCPYRSEVDNTGKFTYPEVEKPEIEICPTKAEDYGKIEMHKKALEEAPTPVWCYFDAVEREEEKEPNFDPEKQRAVLWPGKG